MNRNEWFIEWTGMENNWLDSNEWFIEWTGMSDSLNEQG